MSALCFVIPFLFFLWVPFSWGQANPEETRSQLKAKGVGEEILSLLNPQCQESLNRRLPPDIVWYGTYDREARSFTADFQAASKAHMSLTVISLAQGGCTTIQNSVIMAIGPCQSEAEGWIEAYQKRGVKVKTEEASHQRIYLSTEGRLGGKVYLYPAGNLCLQVFRNLETVK